MPADLARFQDAVLAIEDFHREPAIAPITLDLDTTTFFRLAFPNPYYPLWATFATVSGAPDTMAVRTKDADPALEVAAIYPIAVARAFYRKLIAIGFTPF